MSIISIYRKVHHFRDKFEVYIHLFYSLILIVFSTGLMWACFYKPVVSMYHDFTWSDSTAKITKVEYAYRGYTETFETIHQVKNIDQLKNITGKNTFFIFLNYDYQFDNKPISANYQFDNMGENNSEKFFERIKDLKPGNTFPLKINPNNNQISLPIRETKLNGEEENLFAASLWILGFYALGIYYIRDFIKHIRRKNNILK